MLRPGTMIGGKYRLVELIGEGGMGSVWRAEHEALGRSFAVKFVQAAQGPEAIARFFREAKIAAKIRHGSVVSPTDFGTTEEGTPFLVMELLEGESLASRLSRAPRLAVPQLVEIAAGALAGLEAVHAGGIVHRDIKPGNIFLVREGDAVVAKILDFGASRATWAGPTLTGVETITVTGVVVGTPYYMSDEQVRGLKDLDLRTDLYSVGVILYEALTGQPPFDSESLHGLMLAIATAQPKPLEELRPDLPAGLVAIVKKAMARDRSERFQTARDLRRALLGVVGASSADSIPQTVVRFAPSSDLGTSDTVLALPEEAPTSPLRAPRPPRTVETVREVPKPTAPVSAPRPAAEAPRAPAAVARAEPPFPAPSAAAASEVFTLHREPRPRSRWPIAAVVALVVIVSAGAGLALALRQRPAGAIAPAMLTSQPLSPTTAVVVSAPPAAKPPAVPNVVGPPALPTPVEEAAVSVRLLGVPQGAVVRVDGAIVPGPDVRLPRDGRPRRLVVVAPGQADWSVEHRCDGDGEYRIDMPPAAPVQSRGHVRPNPFPRGRPPPAVDAGSRREGRPPTNELLGSPGF